MSVQTQTPAQQCCGVAFGAAFVGGIGAVSAGLFTTISPLGGAVFGASYALGGHLISWICDKVGCCPDSMVTAVAKQALVTIGGIAAGALVTTLVGFPMTVTSAVTLSIAITVTLLAMQCCCFATGAAAIGAAAMSRQ